MTRHLLYWAYATSCSQRYFSALGVSIPVFRSDSQETATGARNRATAAYHHELLKMEVGGFECPSIALGDGHRPGILGIGIESGLFQLGEEYFDGCIVSAFDGWYHAAPYYARGCFPFGGLVLLCLYTRAMWFFCVS